MRFQVVTCACTFGTCQVRYLSRGSNARSKSSYFDILGIPAKYKVATAELAEAHRRLQRQWHPDRHALSNDSDRQKAAALSAQANEAYSVLQNAESRAQHLLDLKGACVDNGRPFAVGENLLSWVMQARAAIEEAKHVDELREVKQEIDKFIHECIQTLETAFEKDDIHTARTETVKLKYLQRIATAAEGRWSQLAPRVSD